LSSLVIAGDTSGTVTLDAPANAGTTVLTLPATSGTVMVNGPAFSAYLDTSPALTAATFTKIACNIEEFDTNTNYDNSSNYRFTPTVAGYYMVTGCVGFNGTITRGLCFVAKNGSNFKSGNDANATVYRSTVSALIYMNGSTDYVELFAYALGTSLSLNGNIADTYFQASMVRGA
jgi:hypothetical protein